MYTHTRLLTAHTRRYAHIKSVTKTSDGGLPCRGRSAGIFFKGLFLNEILFKSQMNYNNYYYPTEIPYSLGDPFRMPG